MGGQQRAIWTDAASEPLQHARPTASMRQVHPGYQPRYLRAGDFEPVESEALHPPMQKTKYPSIARLQDHPTDTAKVRWSKLVQPCI
jgi:hypothetical protein